MPVVIPTRLRRPTFRGAWVATVAEGILPDGAFDGVYVRLVLYCGDIEEEPFAEHVGNLIGGHTSSLPGASFAAACKMYIWVAERRMAPPAYPTGTLRAVDGRPWSS